MERTLRYSRRQLNASALGAVLGGSSRTRDPRAALARWRQEGAWEPGQGLRLAGSTQSALSLDPALSRDLPTNFLVRQLFRGLLRFDERLEVVPELAETMTISADSLHYNFRLRETARLHDGRLLASDDVRESLSRALRPATAGGFVDRLAGVTYLRDIVGADEVLAGTSAMLSGVQVHDDRHVTIVLRQPSATFPMKLASVPASIVDHLQVGDDATWHLEPNGSGPFRCASFVPGDELVMESTPTWWAAAPVVPVIHVRLGPSASQPVNLFVAGEIDIADGIPPGQQDLFRDPASGLGEHQLLKTPLFAVSYIALGNREPPLDDIHLRRALMLAFPAAGIAEGMFDNAVTAANGLIPDGMLGRTWDVSTGAPDLEAARSEIRASRYRDASAVPPIAIHAADVGPVEALRDTVRRDLGLTIEVVSVNWPDFLGGLASRRFSAYSLYWGADYPDPESLLWMLFGSESPENYTGYRHDAFDVLLTQARNERDARRRAQLLDMAHVLLIEDAAVIPLYFDIAYTAARRGIDGLTVTPMGLLGLETVRAAS